MKNELPKVFEFPITNNINNCQEVFNSSNYEEKIIVEKPKIMNIDMEIKKIFNSRSFIYKKDVFIKTKDFSGTKTIVGKTNNSLLTMDNELIKISDIIDIII